MKLFHSPILVFVSILLLSTASAQDISINVQTAGVGTVQIGGSVLIELQLSNNDPFIALASYKLRPRLTVPSTVSIATSGHILPAGFTIVTQTATVITLSNGTNNIAPGTAESVFINVTGGPAIAPASTVLGSLFFSTGIAPGSAGGPATTGDIGANNSSTSTVEVTTSTLPLTLLGFNAILFNCQPSLNWQTENEINSDRFEIERGNLRNSTWKFVGIVAAKGNGAAKSTYNFIDSDVDATSEKILYRLKMIDKDGEFKYSKILPVLINCKTKQVEVYPNPVKDGRLYVNLTGATSYAYATLLSLTGQVILKQVIKNGTNYLDIAPGTAAGLYLLNINDENGVDKKMKVLIQH